MNCPNCQADVFTDGTCSRSLMPYESCRLSYGVAKRKKKPAAVGRTVVGRDGRVHYYDTPQHDEGEKYMAAFEAKMANTYGVDLIRNPTKYGSYNFAVKANPGVYVQTFGKKSAFTERGVFRFPDMLCSKAKMQWCDAHPDARLILAIHSPSLEFVVFIEDVLWAKQYGYLEKKRTDPNRQGQQIDEWHLPMRCIRQEGWDALTLSMFSREPRKAIPARLL